MDREILISNKSLLDGPVLAPPSSSKKDKHTVGESSKKKNCSIEESNRSNKRPRETTPTPPRERSPQRPRLTSPVAEEQPRILSRTISASSDIPTIQIPGLERMASELASRIVGHAWDLMKRHFGYLIFYKHNIDNMENKFRELDGIRKDVQRQVDAAARERLEEVKNEVKKWLDDAKKVEKEVTKIRASVANNNGFLHLRLHYRLGSQAADQIQVIDDLLVKERDFNRVSHSRPPPCTTGSLLNNYEGYVIFESRESCLNEILDAFKDEAVHNIIGVYGMGGIGKTTLVKEAAYKAMKDGLFTEVVIVTVSQNLDVKRIQTVIAESLGLRLDEVTEEVRAGKIEERLGKEGNRVLVILDDLWEMLELSKVRIPGTCRVVTTTRREDVCDQMGCKKKFELRTLSDEESWSLFNSRAEINVVKSPTIMKEVAWDVAKQCAGLPLALVVLGTALKGKIKIEVWNTVLDQLKKSTIALDLPDVNKKVRESIELSYKFLESEAAKWCFLHCCLHPEDDDIEEADLIHMLVGGGLLEDVESLHKAQERVHVLMDQLKASGLLLDGVNREGESIVRMHDVVRDVAIWIGGRDHGFFVRAGQGLEGYWPRNSNDAEKLQNCRWLSLMRNKIHSLPSDPIMCTKLETLILRGNRSLSNIPEFFFQHMGALKVLDLSFTYISRLPKSLSCLTSLRVLDLQGCYMLQDISPINGLKMLEILILTETSVSVVPEDTGGLLNLRLVNLLGYENKTSLITYFSNVLQGCSRIEQLFMQNYEGCLAELASLRSLTHLHISDGVVKSKDSLSEEAGRPFRIWRNLYECQICFPPSLCNCLLFRQGYLYLKRTKHFSPTFKALLEKLRSLALVHCRESEVISSNCDIPPHMFHNLRQLVVLSCLWLTSLGDEPLFKLKNMRIEQCPKLVRLLPSKVCQSMHQLEDLMVLRCKAMLQLFPYDHEPMAVTKLLPKLVYLFLSELPQLKSVLQPFQCLPNLMHLVIRRCELSCILAYHEMEMVVDPFPKLEKLNVSSCEEMLHLFLYTYKPMAMTELLPNLWLLNLEKLPRLESVLQPFQCLPNLMELRIIECGLRCFLAYHEMEMAADPFPNLSKLDINRCSKMSQIISSSSPNALKDLCIFQNLTHLTVKRCPRLTHLFWSNQAKHMQVLTSLIIGYCDSLSAVVISNENQEEGASASTSTTACIVVDHHGSHSFFPQLTTLILCKLPKMVAFHQPTALPMEWPSLNEHCIEECPELETPLLGPQTSERRIAIDSYQDLVDLGPEENSDQEYEWDNEEHLEWDSEIYKESLSL